VILIGLLTDIFGDKSVIATWIDS